MEEGSVKRKPVAAAKQAVPASKDEQSVAQDKSAGKSVKKDKSVKQSKKRPVPGDDGALKLKKVKVVRDSFTIPEPEYAVLAQLKKACVQAGFEIKKSELIRIGLYLTSQSSIPEIRKHRMSLTPLRAGRPKKSR